MATTLSKELNHVSGSIAVASVVPAGTTLLPHRSLVQTVSHAWSHAWSTAPLVMVDMENVAPAFDATCTSTAETPTVLLLMTVYAESGPVRRSWNAFRTTRLVAALVICMADPILVIASVFVVGASGS